MTIKASVCWRAKPLGRSTRDNTRNFASDGTKMGANPGERTLPSADLAIAPRHNWPSEPSLEPESSASTKSGLVLTMRMESTLILACCANTGHVAETEHANRMLAIAERRDAPVREARMGAKNVPAAAIKRDAFLISKDCAG